MRYNLFLEKKGEKAHRDAVAMGLQYKGFGYWADPNTGEAKYKTVNDNLVPVEPDVESDMYKGGDAEGGPAMAGAAPQQGMVQPGADAAPGGPAIGSGMNISGGLGVDAMVPQKKGWDAGPDGDTCVDGQPKEEVPQDTFVGKTNNLNWTAGPDGSNAMELGEMRRWISEDLYNKDRKAHADRVSKAVKDGLPSNAGTETRFDVSLAGRQPTEWLSGYLKRLRNATTVPPQDGKLTDIAKGVERSTMGTGTRDRAVAKAFGDGEQTSKFEPNQRLNVLGHAGRHQKREKPKTPVVSSPTTYDSITPEYTPSSSSWNFGDDPETPRWVGAGTSAVQDRDAEQVRMMNDGIQDLLTDKDFDLDSLDDLDPVASGAFGSFRIGPNGIGVKRGEIGPGELAALAAMRDNPAFPTLINARFDSPFINQAGGYNNPGDVPGMKRGDQESKYFSGGDESEWHKRFPTAWGKYAMSVAQGEQVSNAWPFMDEKTRLTALNNFWKHRGELHKAGFSHNDMHGGNVFVDPETGEVSILDLGLAKDDPFSALMEATGGFDAEEGEDTQLAYQMSGARIPPRLRERMVDRLEAAGETIMDGWDGDMEDEELVQDTMERIGQVLRGGIRMTNETREQILEALPRLRDREFVMPIIEQLYEGLTDFDDSNVVRSTPSPAAAPKPTQQKSTSISSNIRKIADLLFDNDD
jgi:hypothetical protein